ncbi:MAG: hypothetical protein GF417_10090 [Candidatus Latescibacteria bacterium]|nr:hypothetical protein [bacterium]MBD3424776.1 hypothetical protein [Candidatus Latescibacterota bacterium]
MKRVLLVLTAILVIPGMLMADSSLGVYFDNGQLYIKQGDVPPYGQTFNGYLYIYAPHEVRTFQYQLLGPQEYSGTPATCAPMLLSVEFPWNFSLEIGDPLGGHAVSYNPQLPCYGNGFDLAMTYTFMMPPGCTCADILNFNISIGPAPTSFAMPHPEYGGLYGIYDTFGESDIAFDIDGMTSTICIEETDAEEESWGAVKSMYR